MARREREYRRLPGGGRKRGSFFTITATRAALWAGNDHVLCVYTTGFTEEYKRFYYRDIQAIVTRKNNHGAVVNVASALFLLLFALLALTRTTSAFAVAWWIPAGISFLVFIINVMRGPTCVSYLQTAVSREELPSLGRERTARKAVGILKPFIEAAQGTLNSEEIASRWAELSSEPAPVSRSGENASSTADASAANYSGNVHEALFHLLLLDGLISGIQLFIRSIPLSILGTLLTVVFSILVVVALVKQSGNGLNPGLRGITWGAFGYMVASWAAGYAISFNELIKHPASAQKGQWEMFKVLSSSSPADNSILMASLILSVIWSIPLGISGIVLLKNYRTRRADGTSRLSAGPV